MTTELATITHPRYPDGTLIMIGDVAEWQDDRGEKFAAEVLGIREQQKITSSQVVPPGSMVILVPYGPPGQNMAVPVSKITRMVMPAPGLENEDYDGSGSLEP